MKKSIFWCFFSAYVCMELKVGFRKLRKKWGSSKDLISPSPLLLFLCFKKLRTTWTNIILTNSNIYLELTGYIFTKFFVKMISRNFLWNWVSSCCCLAGSASFECLSFFAFWLSQRLIVHFFFCLQVCHHLFLKKQGERNNEELASDSSEKPQVVRRSSDAFFHLFTAAFISQVRMCWQKGVKFAFLGIGNTKCGQADYLWLLSPLEFFFLEEQIFMWDSFAL